jgi:hypothetical protein
MDTKRLLQSVLKNKDQKKTDSEIIEDTLCINCRDCKSAPNIRSAECMKCMVNGIAIQGNVDKIKLRTSKDMELSGQAVEILCDIANTRRYALLYHEQSSSRACSGCDHSRKKILDIAWMSFPEPNFDTARNKLMTSNSSESSCSLCIQKTYRTVDQAELGMENIRKKVSTEVARTRGL